MANKFRLLRADEIDARVGTAKDGGKGVSLLLYKDARCDQNILDETVGPMNWQRFHSRDNANCTVQIWDEQKNQWISKEDTGTESKTEAEKGLASDSFKRACFNWGIGRELYSAPFIWIPGDPAKLKYEKFTVLEIGYDENREINKLAISDKTGKVVFRYGNVTVKAAPIPTEPLPEDAIQPRETKQLDAWAVSHRDMNAPKAWNPNVAVSAWVKRNGITMEQFNGFWTALKAGGVVPDVRAQDMQPVDVDNLCKAIEMNYGDMLRKPA